MQLTQRNEEDRVLSAFEHSFLFASGTRTPVPDVRIAACSILSQKCEHEVEKLLEGGYDRSARTTMQNRTIRLQLADVENPIFSTGIIQFGSFLLLRHEMTRRRYSAGRRHRRDRERQPRIPA